MAIYKLIKLSNPKLRKPSKPVGSFDGEFQTFIDDMFETMYSIKGGIGLAAPQIGVSQQVSVIDVTEDRSQPLVLVNPELVETKNVIPMQEGCLSVPGVYEKVPRAAWAKIRAQDRHGKSYEMEAEDLLAEAFQHEIDHLQGKLFIDLLSSLKRNRIIRKITKCQNDD